MASGMNADQGLVAVRLRDEERDQRDHDADDQRVDDDLDRLALIRLSVLDLVHGLFLANVTEVEEPLGAEPHAEVEGALKESVRPGDGRQEDERSEHRREAESEREHEEHHRDREADPAVHVALTDLGGPDVADPWLLHVGRDHG